MSISVPSSSQITIDENEKNIQWLRIDDIRSLKLKINTDRNQWKIFSNPKPNDVIQGALGNSFLLRFHFDLKKKISF